MKINKWTVGLAAAGVVSLGSVVQAEEAAHQVLTAVSGTTLSGYVSTSAIWNVGSGRNTVPASSYGFGTLGGPGAYTGTGKQDGFNLDVINLTIAKSVDEGDWGAGYKAELLAGPDAATFVGGNAGSESLGVKQAYVELRAPVGNGLSFKIGVWDTIIGYEGFNAGDNPNFSRSYGYALEPTSYTGLLTSYKINDVASVMVGVANSDNAAGAASINARTTGVGSESVKSYMAAVNLTAPESFGFLKGSTLNLGVIDSSATGAYTTRIYNFYAGGTMNTGIEGLTLGASFDYRGYKGNTAATAAVDKYANASALYLSFKASDKLKFNTRAEYASAHNTTAPAAVAPVKISPLSVLAVTETIDYSLWANVISRFELRWDHDLSKASDNAAGAAFSNSKGTGSIRNNFTAAVNVIYKF